MQVLKKIQFFIAGFLYALMLVVTLCVSLPFHLFRAFISRTAKYWSPGLRQVICNNSHIGRDGSLLVRSNLIISLRIQGIVDVELFTQKFQQKCLDAKQNGIHQFPELQEKIILHYGYPFWAQDIEFNIGNHIFHEGIDLSDEGQHFINENIFLQTPFKLGERSPWVILISIDRGNHKSHIWFKFHHSLGDGISMYNLLMRVADNFVHIQPPSVTKLSWFSTLCHTFPFIPTDGVKNYLECSSCPQFQISSDGMFVGKHYSKSKRIPKQRLKEIGLSLSVPFTAVLLCAITGALREYLLKLNVTVPPYQLCVMPVRVSSQRPVLINKVRFGVFKFPTGEVNLRDRLTACKTTLDASLTSTFPAWLRLGVFISNGYPVKWTPKKQYIPFLLSTFPGPSSRISLGHDAIVEDIHFTFHGGQSSGFVFTTLTYNNGMSIILSVDQNVVQPEENVKFIMESLEEQINEMYSLIPPPQ